MSNTRITHLTILDFGRRTAKLFCPVCGATVLTGRAALPKRPCLHVVYACWDYSGPDAYLSKELRSILQDVTDKPHPSDRFDYGNAIDVVFEECRAKGINMLPIRCREQKADGTYVRFDYLFKVSPKLLPEGARPTFSF